MALENSLPPDAYEKLGDNVYLVTKNYFSASRRLALHESASQWTLSLLSLGLIVMPLLTVTKMPLRYPQNVVDFAAISLAVAVLMFSLLIGANKYSVRSERMHHAGLELNALMREMRYLVSDPEKMKRYQEFDRSYGSILQRYENVDEIDYVTGKISIIRKEPVPFLLRCKYWYLFGKEMSIYGIALLLEFGFIVRLVT
ncbi:MAG: SLATT domain-containing protein [Candidatus Didemnitutus sp.]|nr:SLATT domain-containing protein [Candidatus Didemnitutus sp.]